MGFPLFLLSMRERHGQEEADNNAAGKPLKSVKPKTKLNIFLFIKHDWAFMAASVSITLFIRAVILSTTDQSNETFDYPRKNFLI